MLASAIVTRLESFANRTRDRPSVAVVGGGSVGSALAQALQDDGADVRFLDGSERAVTKASGRSVDAHRGDPTDTDALARLDPSSVDVAVVAAPSDRRTILAAQLLRTGYDCGVVAIVSDPDNLDAIEAMDVLVLSLSALLAGELDGLLQRHSGERE